MTRTLTNCINNNPSLQQQTQSNQSVQQQNQPQQHNQTQTQANQQQHTITIPGTNIQIPTSASGLINATNLQNIKVDGTGNATERISFNSHSEDHIVVHFIYLRSEKYCYYYFNFIYFAKPFIGDSLGCFLYFQ